MELPHSDLAWLAERVGVFGRANKHSSLIDDPQAGTIVEPTAVAAAARNSSPVIALVGWPTGRHHSLIKAAEARLAVQEGATEVWLALDPDLLEAAASPGGTASAVLADIIAVQQVVDAPARLGVVCEGIVDKRRLEVVARAAEKAGVAVLAVRAGAELPQTTCELVVYGVDSVEDVVDVLYAGAQRAFIRPGTEL